MARLVLLLLSLGLALTACGTDAPEPSGSAEQPPSEAPADELPEDEPPASDAVDTELQGAIQIAVEDAAAATGVPASDVEVVVAEAVTWNDGSLGCPEPDGMYTQALVEGYRIVVAVDGEERAYHGAEGGDPAYCADPREP